MTNKLLNRIAKGLSLLSIIVLVFSCSTKKNTWTRRAYHNLTCHYNVYWNGMISLKEGEQSLKDNVEDNYNTVLRVYNYGDLQEAQSLFPKMDRSIKKASIGIQKHSMYFGGKERVKWIDDSYLMMGKAHFYKQDYTSARRVFDYVAKEYDKTPSSYEAILWLAKTHVQAERFEKAEAALNLLQSKLEDDEFPHSVEKDMPLVYADFYLAQENYNSAYPYLERGLELNKKRETVMRLYFILGQINQLEENLETATTYYKKVLTKSPPYKMAFETQMNMARCYDGAFGDSKQLNKLLLKMAEDKKNEEFLDQIYYALSEVATKDNNDTLTIHYLQLSVAKSVSNDFQKTRSSLDLADIYFEQTDYIEAQAYYDTAVSFIPLDFPDYDKIKNQAGILSDMVVQIQTITVQDSLQRLAQLDSTALYAVIDQIIKDYLAEEERKRAEEALAREQGTQFIDMNRPSSSSNAVGGGEWYFYNQTALSFGFTEFKKKWGQRKLEDNWRLSDKRQVLPSFGDEDEAALDSLASDSAVAEVVASPTQRAYYLADIPRTEEQMKASDSMRVEAYYLLGYLYLEELRDTTEAIETYLTFLEEYPENKYLLQTWYALYKVYIEHNDIVKATQYKDLIVKNYPDSDYAKVILDPDYYVKLSEQKSQASKLYERAFTAYGKEQYYRVITFAEKGIEQYPDDTALVPRFLYLRAMSLGKVDVPDTLYVALQSLISEYPASPVVPMAQTMLTLLHDEFGIGVSPEDQGKEEEEQANTSMFSFNAEDVHFVMMVISSDNVKVNALKVRVSDFDQKYFGLVNLRVKSLMLDKQRTLITVGNFQNKNDADNYYSALKNDEYVLSGITDEQVQLFSISARNYPVFYKEKDIEAYKSFYEEYYKK